MLHYWSQCENLTFPVDESIEVRTSCSFLTVQIRFKGYALTKIKVINLP